MPTSTRCAQHRPLQVQSGSGPYTDAWLENFHGGITTPKQGRCVIGGLIYKVRDGTVC